HAYNPLRSLAHWRGWFVEGGSGSRPDELARSPNGVGSISQVYTTVGTHSAVNADITMSIPKAFMLPAIGGQKNARGCRTSLNDARFNGEGSLPNARVTFTLGPSRSYLRCSKKQLGFAPPFSFSFIPSPAPEFTDKQPCTSCK
ncbi:hypothetical protein FS837_009261, partial [Tulasnella sp. UAMH 9824]